VNDSPAGFLLQLSGQLLLLRCVGVAAELRLADRLESGPQDCETLAAAAGVDARGLYRVLRLLASHEVFAEQADGRFALTPRAECLVSTRPGSLYPLFCRGWQDISWDAIRALPDALASREIAFELAHGQRFFDYLATHAESGQAFDAAMALVAAAENPAIARTWDFSGSPRIVDIGGGRGGLLAAILTGHPQATGVLFDQAQVLAEPLDLDAAGLRERCELVAGDFFDGVPALADIYLLKRIIHDWDDDRAVALLRNCRQAMSDQSRLLIIDAVMQPGNAPDPNKATDVSLMVLTEGRERAADEYEALLRKAGLMLVAIHDLPPPATLSIIECASAG
jgi:hypothetical protein